jgi:hypothetical protein
VLRAYQKGFDYANENKNYDDDEEQEKDLDYITNKIDEFKDKISDLKTLNIISKNIDEDIDDIDEISNNLDEEYKSLINNIHMLKGQKFDLAIERLNELEKEINNKEKDNQIKYNKIIKEAENIKEDINKKKADEEAKKKADEEAKKKADEEAENEIEKEELTDEKKEAILERTNFLNSYDSILKSLEDKYNQIYNKIKFEKQGKKIYIESKLFDDKFVAKQYFEDEKNKKIKEIALKKEKIENQLIDAITKYKGVDEILENENINLDIIADNNIYLENIKDDIVFNNDHNDVVLESNKILSDIKNNKNYILEWAKNKNYFGDDKNEWLAKGVYLKLGNIVEDWLDNNKQFLPDNNNQNYSMTKDKNHVFDYKGKKKYLELKTKLTFDPVEGLQFLNDDLDEIKKKNPKKKLLDFIEERKDFPYFMNFTVNKIKGGAGEYIPLYAKVNGKYKLRKFVDDNGIEKDIFFNNQNDYKDVEAYFITKNGTFIYKFLEDPNITSTKYKGLYRLSLPYPIVKKDNVEEYLVPLIYLQQYKP